MHLRMILILSHQFSRSITRRVYPTICRKTEKQPTIRGKSNLADCYGARSSRQTRKRLACLACLEGRRCKVCTMNQKRTNVAPVGSGLQYLKRKDLSTRPSSSNTRGGKRQRFEEQLPRDDRGGADWDEFPIPSKSKLRDLSSRSLLNNFTKQFIEGYPEEVQRKETDEEEVHEEMEEEHKALNKALIELSRTNVLDQTQKRRSVWNLDTGLFHHCKTRKYVSVFSEVVSYPVHSAITDEANVEWFLYSGESFICPSPLAFNISLAICIGTID